MNVITVTIGLVTLLVAAVNGIDLKYLDNSTDPCDDFYQFACGNFGKYHERPNDQQTVGIFTLVEDELVRAGNEILSSPKLPNDPVAVKKAKAAYKACVDVAGTDNLFYYPAPEQKVIEEFGGMPLVDNKPIDRISWTQVAEIAGKFGVHHMFQFMVKNFDYENYGLFMFPDSWEEPTTIVPRHTKTYDEVLQESFQKIAKPHSRLLGKEDPLDVFLKTISKRLLSLYNIDKTDDELNKDLKDIKEFMAQLFTGGIVDDMIPLDNVITLGQLQEWTEEQFGGEIDMNWLDYFQAHFKLSGLNITEDFLVYILDETSVYGILNLVRKTDPRVVKNFILLRTFLFMAPDSDAETRAAAEEYYKAIGLKYYDRWEYCTRKLIDVVDSVGLSFAVAHDFVNYNFNINKIPKTGQLIQNLIEVFKASLTNLDWVDEESRVAIIQKLNNIVVYLGYPDFVTPQQSLDSFYENVRICEWDNYGNAQRIRAFKQSYALTEYEIHDFWGHSPFEVNAYTLRASNRIMIPLAMLDSAFYNGGNPLFDYSRLGSTLAHEFIHHFDVGGVAYNEDAEQSPLLSNSTLENFNTRKQCFIDQYNRFYVAETESYLDGAQTLNENLADNGGLRHVLRALKLLLRDHETGDAQYTFDQLFFINYATSWCSIDSHEYIKKLVEGNEHPPNRFRVLGPLSNLKEFAKAFNCPIGSNMNPENKCELW